MLLLLIGIFIIVVKRREGEWMEIINWLFLVMILIIIVGIFFYGIIKKVFIYELFVEGGKEGIEIVFFIIFYLVGMFVVIIVFRLLGVFDFIMDFLKLVFFVIGIFVEVVLFVLICLIFGMVVFGMMIDLIVVYGFDFFIGRLVLVM